MLTRNDLYQINKWAFPWKISFNPDPSNQAQKIIFSRKILKNSHPLLRFNNSIVLQSPHQKHFGIFLDSQLTFEEDLKLITTMVNKIIGLLQKLQNILPRLEYAEAYNETFHQKLESIQYTACLALSGAIRGLSRERLYQELGLESL